MIQKVFTPTISVLLAAAIVATAPGALDAVTPAQRATLGPDVLARVEAGDVSIPVIVRFHAVPNAPLPLAGRGVPIPKARLRAAKRAIDTGLDAVRNAVEDAGFEIERTFRLYPAFAGRAPAEVVPALVELDAVEFIELDHTWHLLTAEGTRRRLRHR